MSTENDKSTTPRTEEAVLRCHRMPAELFHTQGECRFAEADFARQLERELAQWKACAEMLRDELCPPDKNCSCHINPPCCDCTDWESQRTAISEFERLKGGGM